MKRLVTCWLLCLLASMQCWAQITYPNNWINYQQKYYKIKIAKDALYRIPYSTLQQYDLPLVGSQLAMYHKGQQVPIYVTNADTLGSSDYVEFVGRRNDGEFDRQLYIYESWQPAPERSLFSDTSAYYLTAQPAATNLRYTNQANDLTGAPPAETYFWYNSVLSPQNTFFEGKPVFIAGISRNFADFENGEGYVSTDIPNNTAQNFGVPTRDVYTALLDSARLNAYVVGNSDNPPVLIDHHVRLSVGGVTYANEQYAGYRTKLYDFGVPTSALGSPTTNLNVASVDMGGSIVNRQALGYVSISYPHTFGFSNAKVFWFEIDNGAAKYLEMSNFNGGANAVLYDLTNQLRLLPVVEGGLYKFLLPASTLPNAKRKLMVVNTTGMCDVGTTGNPNCNLNAYTIPSMQAVQFTDYSQLANQGNYLMITHTKLRQGDIDQVERYRQYRSSAAGGSYGVVVADIEELYDQFAWGIAKHPMAIRNFVNYAFTNWDVAPQQMLLLGKSVSYRYFNLTDTSNMVTGYNQCLVPSYGNVASDMVLGAPSIYSYVPRVAIGRIPARTANEVRIYLDKLISYEANNDPNICSRQERVWMKDALHISGGYNLNESNEFMSNLNSYKAVYEDTSFAGRVIYTYNNISEAAINEANLDPYINAGLGLITFFGHSSGEVLNVDINDPLVYTNYDKYPFIITGSCSVGDVHNYKTALTTLPEKYALADQLGSIGWLGSASLGFPTYLYAYLSRFYRHFCRTNYHRPVGYCLQQTIAQMNTDYPNDNVAKITSQEYTLTADPAVILNSWEQPEYIIENTEAYSDLTLIPATITADLDSFALRLTVANLGRAVADSFNISIVRTLPDGTTQSYLYRRPSTVYADTLLFYVPTGDSFAATGENRIRITVDADNELPEGCENNNSIEQVFPIFSDLLIPISPCNYAIVSQAPITLQASTGQPLLPAYNYTFQIDTTELFNSPALRQTTINSLAGVLTWQPTDVAWQANTVYYWRTARAANNPTDNRWKGSSFVYLPESGGGWSQSHYYQYLHNSYSGMQLDTIRQFAYNNASNSILAINNRRPEFASHLQYSVNGTVYQQNTCLRNISPTNNCANGIAVAVFAPAAQLQPWYSQNTNGGFGCNGVGTYGNVHCGSNPMAVFEFNLQSDDDFATLNSFLTNQIPNGYYVLAYSVGNHRLSPNTGNANLAGVYNFFEQMGAAPVNSTDTTTAFIVFGRKNIPNSAQYALSANFNDDFELLINLNTPAISGTMTSPLIGPATAWSSVVWQNTAAETPTSDQFKVKIYGVKDGNETLLYDTAESPLNISSVDAAQYPYLRLHAESTDSTQFTPPQTDFWRVLFTKTPEAALNQAGYFVFYSDTLQEGQPLQLQIAVTNPEMVAMDSLLVGYTIRLQNGQIINTNYPPQAPIPAQQTIITQFSYSTAGMLGSNMLTVELNPNEAQPEKLKFNNLLYLPFFVTTDKINPVLDVTFDGRHIVDGELIAPQPTIEIRVRDENRYLALNDTADLKMWLVSTDTLGFVTTEQPIYFSNPQVQFLPATQQQAQQGNNAATLRYNPQLSSGSYSLKIRANDRSSNLFDKDAYLIGFKVDTRPAISQLLNYPNPFTSATRFVFTVSGSVPPQQMHLQIMTATGKVVREITAAELGDIHIGNNISEFAWDGTDQYGSPLANGLYLYRVVAKLNGQTMDRYQSGADQWTKNELGKMYLVR